MPDFVGQANMDYMLHVAQDEEGAKRTQEWMAETAFSMGANYAGNPIPFPLKPHFISTTQRRLLQRSVTRLSDALEAFLDWWLEDEDLQREWGVSEDELRLYKHDPGYRPVIQNARFDAFLHQDSVRYLEFNCDSPGGTGLAAVMEDVFCDMLDKHEYSVTYDMAKGQNLQKLQTMIQDCYAQWRGKHLDHPEDPFVVFTDWDTGDNLADVNIIIEFLQKQGIHVAFADPKAFVNREDGLYLDGERVDFIFKRVIVKEWVEEPGARDLYNGYLEDKVCMVNSPRSVVVGNKKLLAYLRDPRVMKRLKAVTRNAIEEFVPWTAVVREGKTEFHGFKVNMRDFLLDNKNALVLKAAQSYGGKDVCLGFETEQEQWEALVDDVLPKESWVAQRLVNIPRELYPVAEEDEIKMRLLNVNINPIVFAGKYVSSYSRLSRSNIINVSAGGGLAPALEIANREEDDES